MDTKRLARVFGALAVVALVVMIALKQQGATVVEPVKLREVAERIAAPDFTLKTIDGEPFTLSSVKGKSPIIVNFFSTTCPPCNEEFPHLEAIHKKYRDQGLKIVAVAGEDAQTLKGFIGKKGATFPILSDPTGKVFREYEAEAVPRNIFIDAQGRMVEIADGFDPSNGAAHLDGMSSALVKDMKTTNS